MIERIKREINQGFRCPSNPTNDPYSSGFMGVEPPLTPEGKTWIEQTLWVENISSCNNSDKDKLHNCTRPIGHPGSHMMIDPVFGNVLHKWEDRCFVHEDCRENAALGEACYQSTHLET